jgi:hypothetical protein
MTRKVELVEMILNSLMVNMPEDEKLTFLTEVFILTEDIRHAISYSETAKEEMQEQSTMAVSCEAIGEDGIRRSGEVGSDGINEQF